jgi:hypothetical protein
MMNKGSYWKFTLYLMLLVLGLYDLGSTSPFFSKSVQTCTAFVKTKLAVNPVKLLAQEVAPATPARPPRAFVSGTTVSDYGTVIRILPDDNAGSRHQKFIVRLSTGQTLLIAHNIDIAPRVENLALGDTVSFLGQYESNSKGGVIHWTHRDPKGLRASGWLNHKGQMYQ